MIWTVSWKPAEYSPSQSAAMSLTGGWSWRHKAEQTLWLLHRLYLLAWFPACKSRWGEFTMCLKVAFPSLGNNAFEAAAKQLWSFSVREAFEWLKSEPTAKCPAIIVTSWQQARFHGSLTYNSPLLLPRFSSGEGFATFTCRCPQVSSHKSC